MCCCAISTMIKPFRTFTKILRNKSCLQLSIIENTFCNRFDFSTQVEPEKSQEWVSQPNYNSNSNKVSVGSNISAKKSIVGPSFNPYELKYSYKNLYEMLTASVQKFKSKPLFGVFRNKKFDYITFEEFGLQVQLLRNVLSHHGISKDDKVAIISNNRIEWATTMYAANSLGAQIVPMYEVQLEKDWQYILKDSGSKIVLAANEAIYNQVKEYVGKIGRVESVLCFDADDERMHSYRRWMKLAEKEIPVPAISVDSSSSSAIIYTSGTTGNPKGVELSHRNIISNVLGTLFIGSTKDGVSRIEGQRSLCFLPWAHIYGQTCDLHTHICVGNSMALVNREQLMDGIAVEKPNTINTVPMLYNKVYDGVMKKINEGSKVAKALFFTGLSLARRRNELLEKGKPVGILLDLQVKFFDRIVFTKIRNLLGGSIVGMTSGGAALNLKVLQFFTDIGINVLEGYGLTETSPVVSFNGPEWSDKRLGTCGLALPGVEIAFVDPSTLTEVEAGVDGEVCVSGDNVMVGYYNNPKANEEVFFQMRGKRFFRTGDQGKIIDEKFLKLTGRIKEQFKLQNGKYVVPVVVEESINRSRFIAQSLAHGDNKEFTVALIVPELNDVKNWLLSKHPTVSTEPVALMAHPAVQALISDEIVSACAGLKSYERPQVWTVILEPFTTENQMLTPKITIRRNNVMKAYGHLIEDMHIGKGGVKLTRQVLQKDDIAAHH